jgi:hypothetical protein
LRFDSLSLPLSLLPFLLTNLATFCYSFKLPRNFLSFFLKPTLFCSPLSFPPLNLSFCKTLLPSVYVQISFFFCCVFSVRLDKVALQETKILSF